MIHFQNNMEECIKDLLKRFQLETYIDMFLSNGYDDVGVIRGINEADLQMMGLTCHKEIYDILDLLQQLNAAFTMYMSVNEVYTRPSTENVLSYIADKFERKGMFPSGEECVPVVLEKLENEEIMLPAHNYHIYINKDGQQSTRREYKMLIARYAQELFLPDQSVAGALKLIHDTPINGIPPPKPPKPKVIPLYDQSSGKLVWMNSEDDPNYENINYIYEFLNNLRPNTGNTDNAEKHSEFIRPPHPVEMRQYEDLCKLESSQSQNSSPGPTRAVKKKQTFFKRFKHNLFGKSNSSLDSYLASSTKTLISDRSSECSNSKISFFKNKSKKDKNRFERQRSNSAPEPVRNVNLQLIPEVQNSNSHLNPTYARPYQPSLSTNSRTGCRYYQMFPTPDNRLPSHPPVRVTKSDTFSNTSISSSGSVSGDSAYSSRPSLNVIKSAHRPVIYGPLPPKQEGYYQAPLNRISLRRRCPCGSCHNDNSR